MPLFLNTLKPRAFIPRNQNAHAHTNHAYCTFRLETEQETNVQATTAAIPPAATAPSPSPPPLQPSATTRSLVKQALRDRQAVGGVGRPPPPHVPRSGGPVSPQQQPLLPPLGAERPEHRGRRHLGHVQQDREGHEVRQLEVPDDLREVSASQDGDRERRGDRGGQRRLATRIYDGS